MPKLTGLKKMKHSREFVVTKLLKVAETNAKCHSIEETLFGLHVKHNESSKGLIYYPPDPSNQGTLRSYIYIGLPGKGLRISIQLVSVIQISKENRKVEGAVAQLFRKSWKRGGRLHELHIIIISKNTSQWMTTAIYEIMSKLVPDIMEMGMFLCVQITGKLFKFLYKQFIWIKS